MSEKKEELDIDKILQDLPSAGVIWKFWDLTFWIMEDKDSVMKSFWERSDNDDSKCKRVDMCNWQKIRFSDEPELDEVIYTFWLCWCIATTLVVELDDGTQEAILTHYDPLAIIEWSKKLRELGVDIDTTKVSKAHLFIMAPSDWKQGVNGKWEEVIKEDYKKYIGLLESSWMILGWANTQVTKIPYSEKLQIWKQNQWMFRIVKWKDKTLKYISENYIKHWKVFDDE